MAKRKGRFTFLVNPDERRLIASLARHLQRSESDAVRFVVLEAARALEPVDAPTPASGRLAEDVTEAKPAKPNMLSALGFILLMLIPLVIISLTFAHIAQALELARLFAVLIASLLATGLLAQGILVIMGKVSGRDFSATVSEFFRAIELLNPGDRTEKADSEPEQHPSTEPAKVIGQNNILRVQFRPAISVGGTPLANIHSAIKRNRSSKRRAVRNQTVRSKARSAVKDARVAIASGEDVSKNVNAAASALDKAAEKGIIHKRNAARRKSRLMKAAAKAQKSGK
jgi:small subunit ribosomal protein S20